MWSAALLARGVEVRALVRPAARLEALGWPSSVEVFRADLRTSRDLGGAFEGVDVLLHLAAVVSGGEDAQFAGTVVGTERLLDAMAASACRRLVLCSSFSVYDYSATPRRPRRGLASPQDAGRLRSRWLHDRQMVAGAGDAALRREARLGPDRAPARLHLGTRSRLSGRAGPAVRAAPPGHRSADAHADDACGELRRRLCAGGDGSARPRPDPERGRRPRRAHLDLPLRLYARQRPAGVARACPLLARHPAVRLGFATVFRRATKVPSILIPRRLESRLKPLRFENRKLRETLGWTPPLDYQQCLVRTYGPAPSAALERDNRRNDDPLLKMSDERALRA